MTYDQLLKHVGDGVLMRTAKRLEIPWQTVAAWKARGIPRGRQFEIHEKFPELPISRKRARAAA